MLLFVFFSLTPRKLRESGGDEMLPGSFFLVKAIHLVHHLPPFPVLDNLRLCVIVHPDTRCHYLEILKGSFYFQVIKVLPFPMKIMTQVAGWLRESIRDLLYAGS
ncbi:MAG TPA: hypothetical protein VMW63_03900 [Methanoregulaceae archaeon]|nr:hypothetical protein [Methanoregulaceae archaeon]